jgi:hypothetical protein
MVEGVAQAVARLPSKHKSLKFKPQYSKKITIINDNPMCQISQLIL